MDLLLRKNLVDPEIVSHLPVIMTWNKVKPVIEGIRKESNDPSWYEEVEYLYNEVIKREQKLQQSKAWADGLLLRLDVGFDPESEQFKEYWSRNGYSQEYKGYNHDKLLEMFIDVVKDNFLQLIVWGEKGKIIGEERLCRTS